MKAAAPANYSESTNPTLERRRASHTTMTAKPTFKSGDRSALEAARWVQPLEVAPASWEAIENALRRTLTTSERTTIVDLVSLHASWIREAREVKVSTQQIKATLQALARPDSDAVRLLAASDGWTQAHIETALMRAAKVTGARIEPPSAEQIRAAATSELAQGRFRKGGRGDPSTLLTRAIVVRWRSLGGSLAVWERDGQACPMVRFAAAIFGATRAPSADLPAVAKRLRKALGKE